MTDGLRFATAAMGTRFELVLLEGSGNLRAAGEAAIEEIERWHMRLNRFAADSLLSHLNRQAAQGPVRLDRDTFDLLSDAVDIWRRSGGAFDCTVPPVLSDRGLPVPAGTGSRVDGGAIALDTERWTVSFAQGGLALDLGGIAKGHALDCAGAILREAGLTSAFLHGGTSSVLAVGAPPGERGWRVAIGAEREAVVTLRDEALAVSDVRGQAAQGLDAHIVDPRTGAGAQGARRVTVRGPSARRCDGWATALVVLGATPAAFPDGYEASILF